jgi:hypothetical protein
MVLYPIPPGGGRRRAGSRPDWRISAVFDPIATGPGQGTRPAFCCGCARRSALIYGINRIPGNGGAPWAAFAGAGSAGRGSRAGQRAGCSACAPGRQAAGIKKPRGISPGAWCAGSGPGLAMRISVGLDPKPHVAPWDHDAAVKRCAARGATPSQIRRLGVAAPIAVVNAEKRDALVAG